MLGGEEREGKNTNEKVKRCPAEEKKLKRKRDLADIVSHVGHVRDKRGEGELGSLVLDF